ncbi:MAG: hypothetical protein AVDCRST_MAG22-2022, partial [uncultured Rubrobacteraceae bacterium]
GPIPLHRRRTCGDAPAAAGGERGGHPCPERPRPSSGGAAGVSGTGHRKRARTQDARKARRPLHGRLALRFRTPTILRLARYAARDRDDGAPVHKPVRHEPGRRDIL